MDSPLAPRPVAPGIRTPRVTRATRERKGRNGSFRDELSRERDGAADPRPATRDRPADPPRKPKDDGPGRLLDVEA